MTNYLRFISVNQRETYLLRVLAGNRGWNK
jgi:hypothetical protein